MCESQNIVVERHDRLDENEPGKTTASATNRQHKWTKKNST